MARTDTLIWHTLASKIALKDHIAADFTLSHSTATVSKLVVHIRHLDTRLSRPFIKGVLSSCRMAWWESCSYRSRCLPSADSEEDEEEEDDSSITSTDSDSTAINYVLGDVTHPHAAQGNAIIVHCVGKKLYSFDVTMAGKHKM